MKSFHDKVCKRRPDLDNAHIFSFFFNLFKYHKNNHLFQFLKYMLNEFAIPILSVICIHILELQTSSEIILCLRVVNYQRVFCSQKTDVEYWY